MDSTDLQILEGREIDPLQWDAFVKASPQGGFYAQHAYLTVIRPDWRAYIHLEKNSWQAAMPFVINRRFGFHSLPQPPFTQYLGVMFRPQGEAKTYKRYAAYQKSLEVLGEAWKDTDLIVQHFSPNFNFGIPLHAQGFELSNRYTYYLDLCQDLGELRKGMSSNHQRNIKKGEKRELRFRLAPNSKGFLHILKANMEEGRDLMGGHRPSWEKIEDLANWFVDADSGDLVEVIDEGGEVLAANLLGHFKEKSYSLMGIVRPSERREGTMTFLMWECIKKAVERGSETFDFEGSMIPGVARYFQDFGSYPVSYLQISRNQLPRIVRWIRKSKT